MKTIKLIKLSIVKLQNVELKKIIGGAASVMSDHTDVNTTTGDSYTKDNSHASDSYSRDKLTIG